MFVNIPTRISTSVPRALVLPRMPSFRPCANWGVTYKKKALRHPKADDGDRHGFRNRIKAHRQAGKTIVYIDESGFAHDMPRTHGYGPRGKRCFGKQDWNAKGRTTVIDAPVGSALPTVTLFSCNSDSDVFHAWTLHDPILAARRSGHRHGQRRFPQTGRHKSSHRKGRTLAGIPSAILAGLEPDRA